VRAAIRTWKFLKNEKQKVQMKTKRLMKRDIIFRLKRKSVRRQKKTVLLP